VIVIRPGDQLLVMVAGNITREQAKELQSEIKRELPALAAVIIMPNIAGLAVYRGQEPE